VTGVMTGDGLLRFFADVGYRVQRSPSARWYEAGPRLLLSLPSHETVELPAAEADEVLRQTRSVGLRWVTEPGAGARPSFQMVAQGRDYGLARLSASNRSKVSRGLRRFTIRTTTGAELANVGRDAFFETLERQGRLERDSVSRWHRLLAAADRHPGVEIWSAWQDDTLAAYLIVFVVDDVCELYQGRSRSRFLRDFPNNGLVFSVVEEMLVRRGMRLVTYGIESLERVDGVDAFKLGLGFERRPIGQRILFHPALRLVLESAIVRRTVATLAARRRGTHFWRKAHGLLAFATGGGPA
jgi:hypothetical protein